MIQKALRVEDIDAPEGFTPGAFEFTIDSNHWVTGMAFRCPCGCGREGYLPFKPEKSPSWEFNGDVDKPTLKPSVLQVGGCRWHGWLKQGQWHSV